jgi:hypothetical protein
MAIIDMSKRTLVETAKSTIAIKEEMKVRTRNMARYHQDSNSDEYDESNNEQFNPKKRE